MDYVYLRIVAKNIVSKKIRNLKVMINKFDHIMELNDSNCFVPINLSNNAIKKLKKAFKIAVKNDLNLTQYPNCYLTADQIIEGWR